MTSTSAAPSRLLAIAVLSLAAFGLAGCATAGPEASDDASAPATAPESASASAEADDECAGVTVVVDTGDLETEDDPSTTACIDAEAPILAVDALAEAGVETEGTEEYGDQVVCRVNGVPAEDTTLTAADGTEHHETCASMPAAFAYWSLWTKPAGGEWGYAQEGLGTLEVGPGDAVELLFVLNDEPASPAA